jgi:hypothetical protein
MRIRFNSYLTYVEQIEQISPKLYGLLFFSFFLEIKQIWNASKKKSYNKIMHWKMKIKFIKYKCTRIYWVWIFSMNLSIIKPGDFSTNVRHISHRKETWKHNLRRLKPYDTMFKYSSSRKPPVINHCLSFCPISFGHCAVCPVWI